MGADAFDRLVARDPVQPDDLAVPALADLERGWAEAPAEEAPRGSRWSRWHGGGFLSISLAALVATGAAAATLTAVTGNPLGRVESTAVAPMGGTEHIARVTARDPDGGPPWTVRIGSADAGLVCLNVGQLQRGAFGIRGLDGVFRTSAVGGADQCAVAPNGRAMLANARTFVGRGEGGSTSVVYGIAGPDVRELRVVYPDGAAKALPVDRGGAFVVARRGTITHTAPSLQWTAPNATFGTIVTFGDYDGARRRLGVVFKAPKSYPLDPARAMR